MSAWKAPSAKEWIVQVRIGKGPRLGARKKEVVDRERSDAIGPAIFVVLSEHLSYARGERRLSCALRSLQSDEKRCPRGPVGWEVSINV